MISCFSDSSAQICVIHETLLLKKGRWGYGTAFKCLWHTPQLKPLVRLTLLSFERIELSLKRELKKREHSFSSPHFSSSNSSSRRRKPTDLSYFEMSCFKKTFPFYLMFYHTSPLSFSCSIFPKLSTLQKGADLTGWHERFLTKCCLCSAKRIES